MVLAMQIYLLIDFFYTNMHSSIKLSVHIITYSQKKFIKKKLLNFIRLMNPNYIKNIRRFEYSFSFQYHTFLFKLFNIFAFFFIKFTQATIPIKKD